MIKKSMLAVGAAATLGVAAGVALLGTQPEVTLAGEAYGAYVSSATGDLPETAKAVLPGSGMEDASATGAGVPTLLEARSLSSITTGAGVPGEASVQSISTVGELDLLSGLITADGVVAMSRSVVDGSEVWSDGLGTSFTNLVVGGTAIDPEVAPNTRIDLPGVGYVTLNEQIGDGDGVVSTGIRVNGIHVVLQDATTGATTGEIVVASARSGVGQ